MKYNTTELTEYGKIKVGAIRQEQTPNCQRHRYVMCKGINLGEDNNYYAHWQYISAKTFKPTGKSTSFLVKIETALNAIT